MRYVAILALLFAGCAEEKCDPQYHRVQEYARLHNLHFKVSVDSYGERPWNVHFWNRGTHWYNDPGWCVDAEICWFGYGSTIDDALDGEYGVFDDIAKHPNGDQRYNKVSTETKCKD